MDNLEVDFTEFNILYEWYDYQKFIDDNIPIDKIIHKELIKQEMNIPTNIILRDNKEEYLN